jgi:hypothetical protein
MTNLEYFSDAEKDAYTIKEDLTSKKREKTCLSEPELENVFSFVFDI